MLNYVNMQFEYVFGIIMFHVDMNKSNDNVGIKKVASKQERNFSCMYGLQVFHHTY